MLSLDFQYSVFKQILLQVFGGLKVKPVWQDDPVQWLKVAPPEQVTQAELQRWHEFEERYRFEAQERQFDEVPPEQVRQVESQFVQVFTSALNWVERQEVQAPAEGWLARILLESEQLRQSLEVAP